jgi:hypothetical protein
MDIVFLEKPVVVELLIMIAPCVSRRCLQVSVLCPWERTTGICPGKDCALLPYIFMIRFNVILKPMLWFFQENFSFTDQSCMLFVIFSHMLHLHTFRSVDLMPLIMFGEGCKKYEATRNSVFCDCSWLLPHRSKYCPQCPFAKILNLNSAAHHARAAVLLTATVNTSV